MEQKSLKRKFILRAILLAFVIGLSTGVGVGLCKYLERIGDQLSVIQYSLVSGIMACAVLTAAISAVVLVLYPLCWEWDQW